VVQPLGVGHAMRVFRDLQTGEKKPADLPDTGNIVLPPTSYPSLEELAKRAASAAVGASS